MKKSTKVPVTPAAVTTTLKNGIIEEGLDFAEQVAAVVAAFDGKRHTDKKFTAALPTDGGKLNWYVTRYNGLAIIARREGQNRDVVKFNLTDEAGNRINASKFEDENPSHFVGARKRNASRRAIMSNLGSITAAAAILEKLRLARVAVEEMEAAHKEFFSHWNNNPFSDVDYALTALAQYDDGSRY